MEAANLTLQQLKFPGVHQQRFRTHSSLSWRREDASFCNVTHILYYPDKNSRSVNKSSDFSCLSCHASINKNEFVLKPNKKGSILTGKCIENAYGSIEASSFCENSHSISANNVQEKVGVLLLNLGGPETLDDVQPFLFNLFADPVCMMLTFYFALC
ncbi:ferrochelatase-2, chloroplastic-like [Phalaenopsis equestris]|uniref:ferrochelatase-2, chloroplastic-like n=1 Tax=Phalaenopsis equestris TaxID=78828 RepID=UPI0009E4C66C|nr:ferrochelatase-2, chloroplastic-like [Phalaenopsis equestris]